MIGKRKPFLIGALLLFSACSLLSGLAWSFETLLATRVIMGAAEGPFLPICLAIMRSPRAERLNAKLGLLGETGGMKFTGFIVATLAIGALVGWLAPGRSGPAAK